MLAVYEVESLARQVAVDTEVERIHKQAQSERENARNQVHRQLEDMERTLKNPAVCCEPLEAMASLIAMCPYKTIDSKRGVCMNFARERAQQRI